MWQSSSHREKWQVLNPNTNTACVKSGIKQDIVTVIMWHLDFICHFKESLLILLSWVVKCQGKLQNSWSGALSTKSPCCHSTWKNISSDRETVRSLVQDVFICLQTANVARCLLSIKLDNKHLEIWTPTTWGSSASKWGNFQQIFFAGNVFKIAMMCVCLYSCNPASTPANECLPTDLVYYVKNSVWAHLRIPPLHWSEFPKFPKYMGV